MPKNINWDGVIQSINDFWLPILGVGGAIVIVLSNIYEASINKLVNAAIIEMVETNNA